ncbi:MAG: hypothetical protein Fues2KO_09860 [Fuerstiella sp.]
MSPVDLPIASIDSPHNRIGAFDSAQSRSPENVATQLESVFVSMMLKSMRESMSQDMFAGEGSDTFGGLFDSLMADHITAGGGLGLADMILQSQNSALARPTAGTSRPGETTSQMPAKIDHQLAVQAYQNADS